MAGKDFRFQRHLKLWEEQNKRIKRTIFASLIFGLLIIIRVLNPLTEFTGKTSIVAIELQELKKDREINETISSNLEELNVSLQAVQDTIKKRPWNREKKKLIKKFEVMNEDRSRNISHQEYQDTANATISEIVGLVDKKIIKPLESSMADKPEAARDLKNVTRHINRLQSDLQQWEVEHRQKDWYATLYGKGRAMDDLGETLKIRADEFSNALIDEQKKISQKIDAVNQKTGELEVEITDKEEWLAQLNKQMQKILPGWLRDILDVEDMMQIFPLILLILIGYVFYLGINISRHYAFIAANMNFSADEKKDLSVCSLWTITDRGRIGKVLTAGAYVAFTLVIWGFFEWGCFLLNRWLLTTENINWYSTLMSRGEFLWFGRFVFLSIIGLVAIRPGFFKKILQ